LVIGQATRIEVEEKVGSPARVDRVPPRGIASELLLIYPNLDPMGETVVSIDPSTNVTGHVYVDVHGTTLERVIDRFGDRYSTQRYSPDPCDAADEAVPVGLVEDPDGAIYYLEYRDSGIAVSLDTQTGMPVYIRYYAEAPGKQSSACK
jgi:hypothetical protein